VLLVLVGVPALLFVFIGLFVSGLDSALVGPRGVDEADATNSAGVESGMGLPYNHSTLVLIDVSQINVEKVYSGGTLSINGNKYGRGGTYRTSKTDQVHGD
jgi:hypothetical protein